jgi:aspartate carbamoyltransferase catalytic subunit
MPDITDPDKISGNFKNKDIVSLDQFSPDDIKLLFSHVPQMKDIAVNAKPSDLLKGNLITLLFYEPSSRTYGSFSASVKQLGGQTIDILNPKVFSSVSKGETLEDTIRVVESYSDAIVLRHDEVGNVKKAADAAEFVPVINAGDGTGEHPTQTLLDMYTLQERFGRLDHLTGVLVGDVKNSRTIHSLIRGLSLFEGNTVYLLSPEELTLSSEERDQLKQKNITIIEITDVTHIPKGAHFWYWTRVQKERFSDEKVYESLKHRFVLTSEMLEQYGNKDMVILDPLPRVGTIDTTIDTDPRALYLTKQIRNGMYVRMALMALILGKVR